MVLEEFPNYEQIHSDLFVRIRDLPVIDKLRELRSSHLRSLIRTQGVITRRSGVFPQMVYAAFRCRFCGMIVDGVKQASEREIRPEMCVFCQRKGVGNRLDFRRPGILQPEDGLSQLPENDHSRESRVRSRGENSSFEGRAHPRVACRK